MKRKLYNLLFLLLISTQTFAQLESTAIQKMDELNALIELAEQSGLDARKEKMTLRTAEVFLAFANWDETHEPENTNYFGLVPIYRDSAEKMAELLPEFERQEVVLLLTDAIDFLEKLIDGEYSRKAIPFVDWAQVQIEEDILSYNGQPVFIEDYTWKPDVVNLTQYFGQLDGFFVSPNHVLDETGTINPNIISQLSSKPDGTMGFVFINNQNIPQWAKNKYGAEFEFRPQNNFTDYDIDHPGAKEMMGLLIEGTVGLMADKKYTKLGYMLCNEPHWYTKQGVWATGGVSDYTLDKFKLWLEEKHGSIGQLNSLWASSYQDFEEVSITIPISGNLQGSPKWYDWCLFNMERVTEWYAWMKSAVLQNDPDANVHIKIMPRMWADNLRDHGIDLEALSELSEVIGNDALARNNHMWGPKEWWEDEYAFDWREMTMSYDFMKSVSPNKVIFNSEAHYLSSNKSRNLYEVPDYARTTYWLAHQHGLNASQTWYWARLADGSIKHNAGKGYAGSNNHQPRIVHELHATLMDLNSYAEEITALQRQRKPLRIFHSETSAINKSDHMDDVFDLYAALYFEGIPLGFTTEQILRNQDHNSWDAVLVYETEFVTHNELDALQQYLDAGGTIIMDTISLLSDEYGQAISPLIQSNGILKVVSSIEELSNEGLSLISNLGLSPEFEIMEANANGTKGCHWRAIRNRDGDPVLSILNLGNTAAVLDIHYKEDREGLVYQNLLNGTVVNKNEKIELQPYEQLFLSVVDTESTQSSELARIVYPNPTEGNFTIRLVEKQENLELRIYDSTGRIVLQKAYREAQEITENISDFPLGMYSLSLITATRRQNLKLLKE